MKYLLHFIGLFLFISLQTCKKDIDLPTQEQIDEHGTHEVCDSACITEPSRDDAIFFIDGVRYLWGGDNDNWHFNIDQFSLTPDNLKSGLGREFFKALLDPQYESIQNITTPYADTDEFIIVHSNEGTKAFPIYLMIEHELINDVIDNEPVMISYCALADFVGIFSRNICGKTFTFGLSGYTYFEEGVWDGREAFVFWDRDTESLWYPLFKKAVSGSMINTEMESSTTLQYERISWSNVQQDYPNALVLIDGQEMETPSDWPEIDPTSLDCN